MTMKSKAAIFTQTYAFLFLTTFSVQGGVVFPDDEPEVVLNSYLANANANVTETSVRQVLPGGSFGCITPAGERGACGSVVQCPSFLPFVSQANNPVVLSFFRSRVCRIINNNVQICCPESRSPVLPFSTSLPITFTPQPQPSSLLPGENECGIPGSAKVTFGTEVEPGFWPWLAVLGRNMRGSFFTLCGGSLITTRHVLTAAHCFVSPVLPDLVRLGEHNLDHDLRGEFPEERRIARQISHNYNTETNENDIAIIIMDRSVSYNDFIRPACLPLHLRNQQFNGQSLTVVGYGKTNFRNAATSRIPLEAEVPVVDLDRCRNAYSRAATRTSIDNRIICAGVGGADACSGDSGGPLNYFDQTRGRYFLAGVVSFGVECSRPDFPGVYTKVAEFIPWIRQNLN